MNEVIKAAAELQAMCEGQGWKFGVGIDVALGGLPLEVEGIIVRQGSGMDLSYVQKQLVPLLELKQAPELWEELERRRRALEP